jgi:type I restriction-modification system DNA methylase subunit
MDHAITGMKFDYLLANPPFGVEWKPQADDILKEAEQKRFRWPIWCRASRFL